MHPRFFPTRTKTSLLTPPQRNKWVLSARQPHLISPAAMNTGSLLSWLVMLSTENWEMLSQLLV